MTVVTVKGGGVGARVSEEVMVGSFVGGQSQLSKKAFPCAVACEASSSPPGKMLSLVERVGKSLGSRA